jgi:uncharacterized protein YaiI (UPF0178 family)
LKIWVDADACPGEIKEIIIRASVRLNIPTIFVANKPIKFPPYPNLSSMLVTKGFDVADQKIVEMSNAGDLCISADIPLASDLVKKGVTVIDPRGEVMNESSIGQRLSMRNFMDSLRGAGMVTGGPRSMDNRSKQSFASSFDKELNRLWRAAGGDQTKGEQK